MNRFEFAKMLQAARKKYPVTIAGVCSMYSVDPWKARSKILAHIEIRKNLRSRRIA